MQIFPKKPQMEKLKADLAGLQKRAGELATKRAAAQADLNRAMAAREKHHSEGDLDDDKVGIRLQAAMDSATSSLAGFNEAIRMQAGLVAEAKAKVEAERRAAAQRLAGA